MPLFKIPNRQSAAQDKKALERSRKRKKSSSQVVTLASNATLRQKIEFAKSQVDRLLGSKKDEVALITNEMELYTYCDKAIKNGEIALDTETDGLDRISGNIAGVCLYTPGEKGVYIPIGHISPMTHEPLDNQMSKQFMKAQLDRMSEANVKYILHNAKFDMHICYWMLDTTIKPYWDTLIGANLLNENEPHGLKYQYTKYVSKQEDTAELAKFNTLFDKIPFTMIPPDVGYIYAGFDPKMTYELYKFQEPFLSPDNPVCKERGLTGPAWVMHNIEMKVLPVVFDMECCGVCIDKERANELHDKYNSYLDKTEKIVNAELKKLSPIIDDWRAKNPAKSSKLEDPISLTSPTQLAIFLYDIFGFVSDDKKSGRGTGEEIIENHVKTLEGITDKTRKVPPMIKNNKDSLATILKGVLDIRAMKKYLTTYIDKLPNTVNKRTDRLHCSYNQYGAATGRFSSSDPNLQNIPSQKKKLMDGTVIDAGHDIRQLFKAPEGYYFIGGDYSQQEPRCLACASGDEHMIQAYKDGKDLYATIASMIYNMPYEECKEFRPDGTVNPEGKQRRSSVKPVLLGIMYGRGTASIAEGMGISTKEAENIINTFFDSFPAVADFILSTQENAHENGFVQTICGRKRRLPDMMLDEYEFELVDPSLSNDFDPLNFDDDEEENLEVSEEVAHKYLGALNRARSYKQKQNIIQKALEEDGIKIHQNGGKIADASRQCVNSIIQGSSADITKISLIKLYNDEKLRSLGYRTCLTIHDENIGIVPKENVKEAVERFKEIMLTAAADIVDVPMSVDVEVTERWYGETIEI